MCLYVRACEAGETEPSRPGRNRESRMLDNMAA